jgi:hypothetical protein
MRPADRLTITALVPLATSLLTRTAEKSGARGCNCSDDERPRIAGPGHLSTSAFWAQALYGKSLYQIFEDLHRPSGSGARVVRLRGVPVWCSRSADLCLVPMRGCLPLARLAAVLDVTGLNPAPRYRRLRAPYVGDGIRIAVR